MTLLQLVGARPLRNLLPILMFKPQRVVQVCSNTEPFPLNADSIQNATEDYLRHLPESEQFSCTFDRVLLSSPLPGIEDIKRALTDILKSDATAFVNFSDGTKLMSIGAYQCALEHRIPSFWFDTASHTFSSGDTAPLPPHTPVADLAQSLKVSTLVAAQGKPARQWHAEKPGTGLLDFAQHAFPLWQEHHTEFWTFCETILRPLFRPEKRIVKGPSLNAALKIPLTPPDSSPLLHYLRLAANAGLLYEPCPGQFHFLLPPNLNHKEKRDAAERIFNLIEGSWLELYCYRLLKNNPRFSDINWSVAPYEADVAPYGETDLLCVDTKSVSLMVTSCKSYLPSLEHCEALARRATTLGGIHADAVLCATPWRDDIHVTNRHRQSKQLGVRLLCDNEITSFLTPDS
jgi:hypothetical protein